MNLEFSIQAGSSGWMLDEIAAIGPVLRSRLENNNITHPAAVACMERPPWRGFYGCWKAEPEVSSTQPGVTVGVGTTICLV
jgi:hypothetical protein